MRTHPALNLATATAFFVSALSFAVSAAAATPKEMKHDAITVMNACLTTFNPRGKQ